MNAITGTGLEKLQPKVWKPYISDVMDFWMFFDGVLADPDEPVGSYDGGGSGGLHPAMHIRNGEDGTSRVIVQAGLMRDYCSNGVVFGFESSAQLKAVHRGHTKYFMNAGVGFAVTEAARLSGLGIKKYIEATNIELHKEVNTIVDEWAKSFKVTADIDDWKIAVSRSRTLGDLAMATSDFAGTLNDRDDQVQLETVAGDMILNGRRRVA
jgi:hypothetical protein